jgi:phenylpropionate dioxygenase-like ring-hydroxylating dioxygenase large terminal subunit
LAAGPHPRAVLGLSGPSHPSRRAEAHLRRPAWHYLCLEADIPNHGDYRASFMGEMPVIAVRGEAGENHAFENRCAHRAR